MSNIIKSNYAIKIDKENKSIYRASPKERLIIETINAYGNKFQTIEELLNSIDNKYGKYHHHPLTGPINIEGAKRGDTLKININKINVNEMGQSLSRSAGIDPIKLSTPITRCPIIGYLNNNIIKYNNFKLEYRPMIGMIATTPEVSFIKTGHASKVNGGNLDLPFITEGVNVYLPITNEGAGLYLGDIHAIEGYGELSGISLEASGEIDLSLEIINNSLNNIIIIGKEPIFDIEGIAIVGIGEKQDLHSAIKDAYLGTIEVLKRILPQIDELLIRNIISLIGQNLNGQAYAKTSESTTMIFIKKSDIERLLGMDLCLEDMESLIFNGGVNKYAKNKIRCL